MKTCSHYGSAQSAKKCSNIKWIKFASNNSAEKSFAINLNSEFVKLISPRQQSSTVVASSSILTDLRHKSQSTQIAKPLAQELLRHCPIHESTTDAHLHQLKNNKYSDSCVWLISFQCFGVFELLSAWISAGVSYLWDSYCNGVVLALYHLH